MFTFRPQDSNHLCWVIHHCWLSLVFYVTVIFGVFWCVLWCSTNGFYLFNFTVRLEEFAEGLGISVFYLDKQGCQCAQNSLKDRFKHVLVLIAVALNTYTDLMSATFYADKRSFFNDFWQITCSFGLQFYIALFMSLCTYANAVGCVKLCVFHICPLCNGFSSAMFGQRHLHG